jgi:hypothetical protein
LTIYILIFFQDGGYQFIIDGEPRKFAGTIAYILGDNLGSQYLGRFKQSSQLHRECRVCMGNATEITKCVCIILGIENLIGNIISQSNNT